MSKHTKGTWKAKQTEDKLIEISTDDYFICFLSWADEKHEEEQKANAQLIITASDLLEKLINSNSLLKQQQKLGCDCDGVKECNLCKQIKQNEKLIIKAKGRLNKECIECGKEFSDDDFNINGANIISNVCPECFGKSLNEIDEAYEERKGKNEYHQGN